MNNKPAVFFTDEELGEIADLAACNYSPSQIILYFDYDGKQFLKEFLKKDSSLRQAYEGGKLKATATINKKQLDLAQSGNITAAQIFLKESKEIENENIKAQIFFGDEY